MQSTEVIQGETDYISDRVREDFLRAIYLSWLLKDEWEYSWLKKIINQREAQVEAMVWVGRGQKKGGGVSNNIGH